MRIRPSACARPPSGMRKPEMRSQFPASAPHVTTVGATQGPEAGAPEVACSAANHDTLITSGGGFSAVFTRPSWQDTAVARCAGAGGGAICARDHAIVQICSAARARGANAPPQVSLSRGRGPAAAGVVRDDGPRLPRRRGDGPRVRAMRARGCARPRARMVCACWPARAYGAPWRD